MTTITLEEYKSNPNVVANLKSGEVVHIVNEDNKIVFSICIPRFDPNFLEQDINEQNLKLENRIAELESERLQTAEALGYYQAWFKRKTLPQMAKEMMMRYERAQKHYYELNKITNGIVNKFRLPAWDSKFVNERFAQIEQDRQELIKARHELNSFRAREASKLRKGEVSEIISSKDETCDMPPPGWVCTRKKFHKGPCAAIKQTIEQTNLQDPPNAFFQVYGPNSCCSCYDQPTSTCPVHTAHPGPGFIFTDSTTIKQLAKDPNWCQAKKEIVSKEELKNLIIGNDPDTACESIINLINQHFARAQKARCMICMREKTLEEMNAACDPEGMTLHHWIEPEDQ